MILLLFSVFALLHITTSDNNLRDGSYGSCNYSSRYLSSNTDFLASTPHRLQRLLYEIRTLSTAEKNPNFIIRIFELTQLRERQKKGHIESRSKYNENRKTFRRNRNRILTTPSEEIVGRQNFRERIYVHKSDLPNTIYNKFVGFSSRYNNRKNEAHTNRFENRRIIGFNYKDRDDRNGRKRDILEHVERKPQRHASRDSLRDYSNYDRYTERKVLPQKLVLDRNVYPIANLQNIRRVKTDRETTFNKFAAKRFPGFNAYRNLDKELSQKELRTITNRNEANKDKMNINYSKRVSNEISRRLLFRDTDYFNSLTENRTRHERAYNREVNEIGRGTRNIKLEIREASRFRDYVRNKRDEASRIQNNRQNIDQFDVHSKREDIHNHRRTYSEETKILFDRKYNNCNVRYNRDMKERIILQDNNDKESRVSDNRESINFEEIKKRINIFESRNNNGQRNVQKNRLSVWCSFTGRFLERDNERRARDTFSIEHSQVRYQISRSRRIQRDFDDNASDRILRSNRITFSLASDVIESDENIPKLIDLEVRSDNIISRAAKAAKDSSHNRSDIKDDNISEFNNIRHSLKNQLRVREGHHDRTISRIKENAITSRSDIRIARISTAYVLNQRSRSNENGAGNNLQVTQKIDDERSTKPSQKDRSINMRRIGPTNENRYSTIKIFRRKEHRTHKIQNGNVVFEIKWQYLFYALQFVYLLSIIMQFPKNNKGKNRIFACMTPAEYLKSD